MRGQSRVVIIGGGIAGCSLLYHLTKLGWSDVMLVEADELTTGSTWHAAGLCTQFNSSWNIMRLLKYSLDLYEGLEARDGTGSRSAPLRKRPPGDDAGSA